MILFFFFFFRPWPQRSNSPESRQSQEQAHAPRKVRKARTARIRGTGQSGRQLDWRQQWVHFRQGRAGGQGVRMTVSPRGPNTASRHGRDLFGQTPYILGKDQPHRALLCLSQHTAVLALSLSLFFLSRSLSRRELTIYQPPFCLKKRRRPCYNTNAWHMHSPFVEENREDTIGASPR